jgi:hypothetical protein
VKNLIEHWERLSEVYRQALQFPQSPIKKAVLEAKREVLKKCIDDLKQRSPKND